MSNNHPAIVVPCFNRPACLARLLDFLNADEESWLGYDVYLVIVIDPGGGAEVQRLADGFHWKFGPKRIIKHDHNLGLRRNILFCGDLSREYGAVIVIEDDLVPSPGFGRWVRAGIEKTRDDKSIAGISLYSYEVDEIQKLRFRPLQDGYDNYYLQFPSSWGQIWTAEQWQGFREWYDLNHEEERLTVFGIHERIDHWAMSSWKKYFAAYMVAEKKFFLFPRISLILQVGDPGTHQGAKLRMPNWFHYQAMTPVRVAKMFIISDLAESLAQYDHFFELTSSIVKLLVPELRPFNFVVDLRACRPLESKDTFLVLTVRTVREKTISWSCELNPVELNLVYCNPGHGIALARPIDLGNSRRDNLRTVLFWFMRGDLKPSLKNVVLGFFYFIPTAAILKICLIRNRLLREKYVPREPLDLRPQKIRGNWTDFNT